MTAYHLIVDQHVRYHLDVEADSPEEAAEVIASGDWDDANSRVISERVDVYDDQNRVVPLHTST